MLAFFVPLIAYASALSPWPDSWDYGEYETVPYILGIPHATGFPAFVLLGWLFSHVVAIGTVALRMKLLSACFVAGSALLIRRLAVALGASDVPALIGALIFACTSIAWTKALHTDVHAMALFFSLAVFVLVMAHARSEDARFLVLAGLAYGFGLATHPNVMWSGIALLPGLVVLARRHLRQAVFVVAAAAVPLTLYAYFPIRSTVVEAAHLDPAQAAPIFGKGAVAWDNNRPNTLGGFLREVSGSEFSVTDALAGIVQVWRYPIFAYDWARAAASELSIATIVLAAIGIAGLMRLERRLRIAAFGIVAAVLIGVPFTFSFSAETDLTRYVLASIGVTLALAASSAQILPRFKLAANSVLTVALLAIFYVTYVHSAYEFGTRNDRNGQRFIENAGHDIPDGAIVLSGWIEITSLAYGAYVDRSLGTRIPISWLRQDESFYLAWSKTHPVYMVTDFVNEPELMSDIPASCRHLVADHGDQNAVYRIRCEVAAKR